MKLKFKTSESYQTAKTLLEGHDYKFTHYNDELAIRFYTEELFKSGMTEIAELGIHENVDYAIDDYEYRLPALENGYSVG